MANQGCGVEATWYQHTGHPTYRDVAMQAKCGEVQTDIQGNSRMRFCERCEGRYRKMYQQGWETYPGDKCIHNVYVGGSGPDYMCGICEGWG